MIRWSFLILNVFFFGCNSTKKLNKSTQILFSIEKGPCFGTCPQYKLEVYSDGSAYYYGFRNVDKIGEYKIQLSDSFTKQIKKDLCRSNLEKLDTAYVNKYLTDFPAIDLCFDIQLKRKCIHVFHEQPPTVIMEVIHKLEFYEQQIDWTIHN